MRPFRALAADRLSQILSDRNDQQLGRLAVGRGLVTPEQLEQALAEQSAPGPRRPLGDILKARGWIGDAALAELSRAAGQEAVARMELARTGEMPEEARAAAADPTRHVDEFVLVEIAGHGASGDVWKAWDRQLGRWVALKISAGRPSSPAMWERFRREILAVAKLQHPNIVPIHRVAEHQGRPYIVMRLVEGRMIGDVSVTVEKAVQLVRQAALAVHHAHQQGVVHRDLKPANIMVDMAGTVWLLDFGLAFLKDATNNLTASGALLGTPAYMSPEQARSATEAREPASDVYSLGATLYELVTRRRPFEGSSVAEVIHLVIYEDVVPPRRINAKIPADVETIILRAMDKDASRRYRSAADFAEDLRRHLDGEPIAARPASWTYRIVRRVRKHSSTASLAVAAAATAVAVLLGAWLWSADAERKAGKLLESGRPALDQAMLVLRQPEGDIAELQRRVAIGQKYFEEAVRVAPRLALAQDLLGRAWELQGRDDLAEASWRKAIELDPDFGPAHFHLGRRLLERAELALVEDSWAPPVLNTAGQPLAAEASREIEAAIAARGGLDDDLQREIAAIISTMLKPDAPAAARRAEEALQRFASRGDREELWVLKGMNDPQLGPACFDEALKLRPQYPLALLLRAFHHMRRREYAAAEEKLSATLKLRPRMREALQTRAKGRFLRGDVEGAIADMTESIRQEPGSAPAWSARAGMLIRKGDLDGARADLDEALRLDPGLSATHANLALLRHLRGDAAGALKAADESVRLAPESPNPYASRAPIRAAAGDLAGAIRDCDKALALDPNRDATLQNRGMYRAQAGDAEGALRDYKALLDIVPRHVGALVNRSKVLETQGDLKGALADLDLAVEAAPRVAMAWFNRGIVHLKLGDDRAALVDFDRTIDVEPREASAFYWRAVLKKRAGDREGAITDAARSLELAPPAWPLRDNAERLLQGLKEY